MEILYLECSMGAAGDMLLAALYELLPSHQQENFLHTLQNMGLSGVTFAPHPVTTCGLQGTHMTVTVHGEHESPARPLGPEDGHPHLEERPHHHSHHAHSTPGSIAHQIDHLNLPAQVKEEAQQVYQAIAKAEAQAHGCDLGDVHYHEVGALDAVADIVGVCLAIHLLKPQQIVVSPVQVGSGVVSCAHGTMPVPAPATVHLLTHVPIYSGDISGELCTPTGAALLSHFATSFGPMPLMVLQGVGIGVGSRTFSRPNCVRAFGGNSCPTESRPLVELVCNLDDMTPEALAFATQQLLQLGARDVYSTPGTMKKGRSGWVLTVLCPPERTHEFVQHIFCHTTTNGLRIHQCEQVILRPSLQTCSTPLGPVSCKLAQGMGVTHWKPEYEDVARLATQHHLSYQAVLDQIPGQH